MRRILIVVLSAFLILSIPLLSSFAIKAAYVTYRTIEQLSTLAECIIGASKSR
ncbi:MAG: hypothetical protein QXX99_07030 [Candidatus Bathyarchaeia archaeon]